MLFNKFQIWLWFKGGIAHGFGESKITIYEIEI